jgi:division protein CdvB (Snf7/Vps24/ESCRT-III family)
MSTEIKTLTIYTLDECIDELIGKPGTKRRDKFEESIKKVKPPIGLTPKEVHDKLSKIERFDEVKDAIYRYLEAGLKINIEWIQEYNELIDSI